MSVFRFLNGIGRRRRNAAIKGLKPGISRINRHGIMRIMEVQEHLILHIMILGKTTSVQLNPEIQEKEGLQTIPVGIIHRSVHVLISLLQLLLSLPQLNLSLVKL
jgi:hypothetical protein